jgi:tetratricopeptide (TPR) repeat protein
MAPPTPDPPKVPKDQKTEDTFLFMGTRIPLPSTARKQQESEGSASTGAVEGSTPGKSEPLLSSKTSFDLEPLTRSSRDSSSSRTFVLGGGLLLVAVIIIFLWHRFGSTEANMFQAANAGQLVLPRGTSAFDLYRRLKAGGVSPVTRDRLKAEVLPKLSEAGEVFFKKVRNGVELAEPEQEQLIRIYEFATDIDPQSNALFARRAYAAAYSAAFMKEEAQALVSLREAFQSDSQWALPFRDVARLYARAGNYANAEYFYQQTLQLAPKWALPALELGKLAVEYKRPAEAELAFRRAIDADPTLPAPWAQLGFLYESQKRKAEAISAYEKALQLAELSADPAVNTTEIKARVEKMR